MKKKEVENIYDKYAKDYSGDFAPTTFNTGHCALSFANDITWHFITKYLPRNKLSVFVIGIFILLIVPVGFSQSFEDVLLCRQRCAEKSWEEWRSCGEKYDACAEKCDYRTECEDACRGAESACYDTIRSKKCSCPDSPDDKKDSKCIDSDSGKDYYTKGLVNVYDSYGNLLTNEDKCKDDINLFEQYCEGNEAKEEEYDCKLNQNMICRESKCQENMRFETPVELKLENPPYNTVIYNREEAVLMAHPEIFSDIRIIDYMNQRFYDKESWKIVSENNDLISVVNILHPDPERQVKAKFSLKGGSGQTEDGKCVILEQDYRYQKDGQKWMCFAEFEPQMNKRGEIIQVEVTVTDDKDEKITTNSNYVVVANYEFHTALVEKDPIGIEYYSLADLARYFIKLSGLGKNVDEQINNPKTSYKFIYYTTKIKGDIKRLNKYKGSSFVDYGEIFNYVLDRLNTDYGSSAVSKRKDKFIIAFDDLSILGVGVNGFTDSNTFYYVAIDVVVNQDYTTLAHELGHAYYPHFCDEYRYDMWLKQKERLKCKNRLPEQCIEDYKNYEKYLSQQLSEIPKFQASELSLKGELFCIKGTSIMGASQVDARRRGTYYPSKGECPIGEC